MAGWLDKLKGKAQDTLQDPQKMDSIKGKVSNMISRRLAARSARGGYYGPGMGSGPVIMGEPGYGTYGSEGGEWQSDSGSNATGWDSANVPDSGGWDSSGASDSGGWDSGGGWDGGGSDSGGGGGDGGGD